MNLRAYSVSSEDGIEGGDGDTAAHDSADDDDRDVEDNVMFDDFVQGQQPPGNDDVVVLSQDPNAAPRLLSQEEVQAQRALEAKTGDTPMPSPGQPGAADAMDAE